MRVSIAARRLAEYRTNCGASLRDVAEKIGVSTTVVRHYEHGVIRPNDERRRILQRLTRGFVRVADWDRFEGEQAEAAR